MHGFPNAEDGIFFVFRPKTMLFTRRKISLSKQVLTENTP
jgi:hypothetical protein